MIRFKIKLFLGLLLTTLLFHCLILVKIIPYDITWGGRLTNDNEMYVFEIISILIILFLSWILLMKGSFVKFKFSDQIVKITLWIFFVLFILNTIGNIFAKNTFEKYFAILTASFALLLYNILVKKETSKH